MLTVGACITGAYLRSSDKATLTTELSEISEYLQSQRHIWIAESV